jgi:hypothetical protein
MSGTAQRLKHATRIESQKHGHFLTLFEKPLMLPNYWRATCTKCGELAFVNLATKTAHPLKMQCDERRLKGD